MKSEQQSNTSQSIKTKQPHQSRQQAVTPLWWTGSTIGTKTTREVEPEDRPGHLSQSSPNSLTIDVTPKARVATLVEEDETFEGDETTSSNSLATPVEISAESSADVVNNSQHSLDDIQEASSSDEALSPAPASSPSQQRLSTDADGSIDPAFYGLSHWAIRRPEPEGLSDIAEEGSVLSASITSGGEEDRSRSLSPVNMFRVGQAAVGDVSGGSGTTSLTEAATQFLQDHRAQASVSGNSSTTAQPDTPRQWRYLRDEIGIRRCEVDEEEEEDDEDEDQKASDDLAFSPPTKPQPGPSLPVMSTQTVEKDAENDDQINPGAININRKKPKGDVWW
jgi:hypothetical protein